MTQPSILTTPRPWWQRGLLSRYGDGRLVPDVAGGWGSLDVPGLAHVALSRFEDR